MDRFTSYPEAKTILKAKQHSKWSLEHPRCNKIDPYYLLTRREQVTVFRLRTGHNRLYHHLYFSLNAASTRSVSLWYWQSGNRTSAVVLPHLRATQKGNLARPHSRSSAVAWGTYDVLPSSSRGLEFPSDEREEEHTFVLCIWGPRLQCVGKMRGSWR